MLRLLGSLSLGAPCPVWGQRETGCSAVQKSPTQLGRRQSWLPGAKPRYSASPGLWVLIRSSRCHAGTEEGEGPWQGRAPELTEKLELSGPSV